MPLLKADQFGNIYEVGFGGEARRADVTHEEDNVVYGDYSRKESIARKKAKRKSEALARSKQEFIRNQNQAKARKEAAQKERHRRAKIKHQKMVQEETARNSAAYMKGLSRSKNPFRDQFSQAARGDVLVGFNTKGEYVSKKNMGKGHVTGAVNAEARGNTSVQFAPGNAWTPTSKYDVRRIQKRNQFFGAYEHPMSGMDGFSIKKAFKKVVKVVRKPAGKLINAPLNLTHKVMTTVPGVRDVHKGLDKLTGGTLSSFHRTLTLPGRAIETGKVSKAELLEAVVNVVKVGAIVVSGGSAVAVIGAAAGALKGGPLGKTKFGNALLSVGEVAGLAYGAGTGLSKAIEKKAIDVAAEKAASEVGKKAGPLGAIAASVAVQAGAAGAGGGKVSAVPQAATTQAAGAASKMADVAANNAAKELAKSGMKFSTDAAMAEAKKLVVEQAKGIVASEFKKKTGIPLDIATQVAQGKVPTAAQVRDQMKKELIAAPEHLKSMLADIPKQMANSDKTMGSILLERQKVLTAEIIKRDFNVAKVQDMTSKELVEHNVAFKSKAELYVSEVDEMVKIDKLAQAARLKANNSSTNMADKLKFGTEATTFERELLRRKDRVEPLGNEVAAMLVKSRELENDGAARLAIAEYGGATKYTSGTGNASAGDLRHPMLSYGLMG
jgi:hypothetical protein